MILYHGSPHRFDRFDLAHMGTGEGTQAFGAGIYLTDTVGVASHYASNWRMYIDGKLYFTAALIGGRIGTTGLKLLDQMLGLYRGDVEWLLRDIRGDFPSFYAIEEADFRALEKPAEALLGRVSVVTTPNLYTVAFDASPAELINLDLPLTEQPLSFREIVEPAIEMLTPLRRAVARDDVSLFVGAISTSRKRGQPLEPELQRAGFKGSVQSFPSRDKPDRHEFVAYSAADLTILDVREPPEVNDVDPYASCLPQLMKCVVPQLMKCAA